MTVEKTNLIEATGGLKVKKAELQTAILILISEFEKETGMTVKDISPVRLQSYGGKTTFAGIEINIQL